jgi:hypothetical protein
MGLEIMQRKGLRNSDTRTLTSHLDLFTSACSGELAQSLRFRDGGEEVQSSVQTDKGASAIIP